MRKITTAVFIILLCCTFSVIVQASEDGSGCSNKCDQTKSCKVGFTNGHMDMLASKSSMDSQCLARESANGCFNTVPTSCAGSYAGLGYRPNGAGGNSKPRNHYGSDIGMAACKQNGKYVPINVYAAADGVVKYARTATCGGRTIVIQHDKKCTGSPEPNYKSTYRHLLQYKVSEGDIVKKGTVIGIVGGSNAGKKEGSACDNPEQAGWPGYTTAGCAAAKSKCGTPYYAIHMHFEIEEGKASSSGSAATGSKVMSPNCNNLQVLCGGCPNNSSSCGGSTKGAYSDGKSGDLSYSTDAQADQMEIEAQGCKYGDYLNSDDCIFCSLFRRIFNATSIVAKAANDGLAIPTRNLVAIGFLIWILVYLLKQVTSFSGMSTGEMLKGLLFQGFRVSVVIIILSGAIYWVMDLTINPIMQTGMEFVQTVNATSTCKEDAEYMTGLTGYEKGKYEEAKGGLSIEMGKSMLCSIKNLEDATGLMMNMGKYSMCIGHNVKRTVYETLPHFGYVTTGWFLWLAGLMILLMFPWLLLDCMLQLSIAVALAPCAIGAYAFKITSKYLKIIFNFFINAMFNIVFLALVVYIINSYLKTWLGIEGIDPEVNPEIFVSGGPIDTLIDAVTGKPMNGLAWWGVGAFKVFAISFFCYCFFDEAKSMANNFASSPGLGGSKGIGAMIGGTLGGLAKEYGGKPALKMAKKGAKGAGQMINSAYGNKFRSGMNHAKGRVFSRIMPKGTRTTDANGNTVYKSSMNILGFQINRTVQKDENGVWTQVKEVKQRSGADKAFEKVLDKNGNEIKDVLKDKYGNAVKDENGNDVMVTRYKSNHRFMGIKGKQEDMYAIQDENGKLIYQTADGQRSFTMGDDGQIATYKTPFTGSLFGESKEKEAVHYRTVRTTNDAFSKTREFVEADGSISGSETTFKNVSSQYLVNKDGTINKNAFNQIKHGSQNQETAAAAIVGTVMQQRGQKLENTYKNRNVKINDDGSMTINQTNNDGTTQVIQAKMIGDQMVIQNTITDSNGNISRQTTNGMRSEMETFRVIKDKKGNPTGNYTYRSKTGFTEYVMSQNTSSDPLSSDGKWGIGIDRDKAMAGFTHESYERQIAQLNIQKMQRANPKNFAQSAEYQSYEAQVMQKKISQSQVQAILANDDFNPQTRMLP